VSAGSGGAVKVVAARRAVYVTGYDRLPPGTACVARMWPL
jgi:hypothetical protein